MDQNLFDRFRRDRSPQAQSHLLESARPLVYSVCRRYLRDPADVEDAAQETFLRLLDHAGEIHTDVQHWLTATAYACSVNLIRRALRERRHRDRVGEFLTVAQQQQQQEHHALHEAIRQKLGDALLGLDEPSRERVVARFFRKDPLRVIAGREGTSVATMSRRMARTLADLAGTLRGMGVRSVDDLTLAEHFGDPVNLAPFVGGGTEGLRFAPDWWPIHGPDAIAGGTLRAGWNRPIRVGAFVGYRSSRTVGHRGIQHEIEEQVKSSRLLIEPGFQLIGLTEPGTTGIGAIERTLREYELTGGLIDATDVAGLKTLDVILFGINIVLPDGVAAALVEAVSSGVGLLNEWWSGWSTQPLFDRDTLALMLAGSPAYPYHTPGRCGTRLPATVHEEHALLPGFKRGDRVSAYGCGPVYRPAAKARVLISKDQVVTPEEHGIAGLGPQRMPVFVIGELGEGRVIVNNFWNDASFEQRLSIDAGEQLASMLEYLAQPRRERGR